MRDVSDATGALRVSFVSEATADAGSGAVRATNDHFEHLTCFVGGLLVLGAAAKTSGGGPCLEEWVEGPMRAPITCLDLPLLALFGSNTGAHRLTHHGAVAHTTPLPSPT